MTNAREQSKLNWACDRDRDLLKLGCLQRIADAMETMSQNYSRLIEEREFYQKRWREEERRAAALERSNRALRGTITRMKNRTRGSGHD